MNDKANKATICSVVTLEIIDFAKKTEADQVDIKNQLNSLIERAAVDIPQDDRVVVEEALGVVIVCNGPMEDALEDALFISLTVRDEILKNNAQSLKPWYVQFGINLGNARLTTKKGRQVIVGEGVDEARRITSFANPNQILVSRVYYDMASKVTKDISNMFEQYDMHAHEQEIYAVQLKQPAPNEVLTDLADGATQANWQSMASKINLKYAGIGLLAFATIFLLGKQLFSPTVPTIVMDPPVVAETPARPKAADAPVEAPTQVAEPVQVALPEQPAKPTTKLAQETPVKTKVEQKKVAQNSVVEAKTPTTNAEKSVETKAEKPAASTVEKHSHVTAEAKPTESKAEKKTATEKSSWESFKNSVKTGTEHACTQAESAMGQCTR